MTTFCNHANSFVDIARPAGPETQTLWGRDCWGGLMGAAQAGNGGAYRRLLFEIRPWLDRYFARRLPMGMVDDAVQDTMIALHQKRHTYEHGRPFRAWLGAIARHKWVDRLRAMQRQGTVEVDDESIEFAIEDHRLKVVSAVLLEKLIARLKPSQATVIHLVKLQGFSIEEASSMTGQSIPLVKVNIHRGIARLAAIVETEG